MARALRLVVLLLVPAAGLARNPASLGSFTIADHPERVPDWYAIDDLPLDTGSWTVVDVTSAGQVSGLGGGCSPLVIDGGDDSGNAQCILDNVGADTVLHFPAGEYHFASGVRLNQGRVVLRGDGVTTVFTMQLTNGDLLRVGPASGAATDTTSFDGPYAIGTSDLSVGSSAGYAAGDWVLLSAWPKPDSPRWSHVQTPGTNYLNQAFGLPIALGYAVKVQTTGTNQLTIDRPLREDWSTATDRTVSRVTMLANVGLEDIRFRHTDAGNTNLSYKRLVQFNEVVESWIVGCQFDHMYSHMVNIGTVSARNVIRGNRFDYFGKTSDLFNNAALGLVGAASDNVVEDNIFTNLWRPVLFEDGAVGNVVAYNYHALPDQQPFSRYCERGFFFHGDYNRANLVEGNDTYCRIESDAYWGRQGPNNTLYRNRVAPSKVCFDGGSSLGVFCDTLTDCSGATSCEEIHWGGLTTENEPVVAGSHVVTGGYNLLGNIASSLHGRPRGQRAATSGLFDWPESGDNDVRGMWLEGNVFRSVMRLNSDDGDSANDCGTGTGKSDCPGDNVIADAAPAGWSTTEFPNVPASLYRNGAPSWWCDEACSFTDPYAGIGAFGDNIAVDQLAGLCKLPAQIRFEDLPCNGVAPTDGGPEPDGYEPGDAPNPGDGRSPSDADPDADPGGDGGDGESIDAGGLVSGCGCRSVAPRWLVLLAVCIVEVRHRRQ